jgi:hypothetical protein
MGTKQLLLIVLGVIVVTTAVYTGIDLFTTSYDQEVIDTAILRLHEIGTYVKKHHSTPEELGGGGGSFKGFKFPEGYSSDPDWRFRQSSNNNRITINLISKKRVYKNKPYRIRGQFRKEGLFTAHVQDPETNKWNKFYDVRSQ